MTLTWNDVSELLELLFSIRSEIFIWYDNPEEVIKETKYDLLENLYISYVDEMRTLNWEHGNTEIRIKPKYRYVRIKTNDLELVRLIRTACLNKRYTDLEISLSVP